MSCDYVRTILYPKLTVCIPQRKKGRKKGAQFNRIGPLKTVTYIESVERDSGVERICGGQTEDLEKW